MNALSGFPRTRLPDYDNNLVFSVLSGELATHWPWFYGFYCPSQAKGSAELTNL
jgi:hypothetical protein